jgi:YVTN family beta-propeller protein/VCBS repeat-containing protein
MVATHRQLQAVTSPAAVIASPVLNDLVPDRAAVNSEQAAVVTLAAAATNSPPQTTGPTVNAPNSTTGAVTGRLNFTDSDGDTLSYAVTTAPSSGSLTMASSGTFVYTPRQSARLNAGATLPDDFDQFVVTASDGKSSTPVTVKVSIYPGQLTASSSTMSVGSAPAGVVTFQNRIYVANTQSNTITAIDAATNNVIATVPVGRAPSQLAVSPDGSVLYVTNSGSNTLSAISTASGATIATVAVGSAPQGITVNPINGRIYVANSASNSVTVLNSWGSTAATVNVGSAPVSVAVNASGTRVFVANRGSNTVSAIDTSTNAVVASYAVGALPNDLAVSADDTRLYVANYGSSNVTVVNLTTSSVATTIALGHRPSGLEISRDRSLVYVVNSDGTMSLIDTATSKKVTGTLPIESGPGSMVAISPDGNTAYVTNIVGATVRSVSLVHRVTAVPPTNPGSTTTQTVRDDFNGAAGTAPNAGIWSYHQGAGGATGELNAYTNYPRNASLDGAGNLVITAIKEPIEVPGHGTYAYSSAWLTTENKLEFTYGTVTARVKLPAEQGLLPAVWMLGSDTDNIGWPLGGEIDVMELANTGSFAGSSIHGPGGYVVSRGTSMPVADEFHNYWVKWEPNKITTGIDNTTLTTFTPDSLPPGTPWTFNDRRMYVILSMAVGSPYGQPDATTQLPAHMVVDWVQYQPLTATT